MDPATTQAVAKATEESAKTAGQALEIVHDTGGYLSRVVGDLPDNAVGLLGADWLREQRLRRLDAMRRRTAEILRERDVKEAIELSPNQATELLTAAQDEGREALAELWARLLANALDPNLNNVRHSFIAAVREMDPPDARIMYHIYREKVARIRRGGGGVDKMDTSVEAISRELGDRNENVEVSIDHLAGLGFLSTLPNNDPNILFPNAILREFMRACYPELRA